MKIKITIDDEEILELIEKIKSLFNKKSDKGLDKGLNEWDSLSGKKKVFQLLSRGIHDIQKIAEKTDLALSTVTNYYHQYEKELFNKINLRKGTKEIKKEYKESLVKRVWEICRKNHSVDAKLISSSFNISILQAMDILETVKKNDKKLMRKKVKKIYDLYFKDAKTIELDVFMKEIPFETDPEFISHLLQNLVSDLNVVK